MQAGGAAAAARHACPLDGISGQIVGAMQAEVREVVRVVGVQVVDLHETQSRPCQRRPGRRL